jgi:hypothetical protein
VDRFCLSKQIYLFYLFIVNLVQFLAYGLVDRAVEVRFPAGAWTFVLSTASRPAVASTQLMGLGLRLTTHVNLVAALRISLAVPPLLHTSF